MGQTEYFSNFDAGFDEYARVGPVLCKHARKVETLPA